MRELKFRSWVDNGDEYAKMEYFTLYNRVKQDCSDSYEVMQYTGFKDKNAIDIYEGDVVRIKHTWKGREHVGEVVWHGSGFNVEDFYFTHYDTPDDAFSEGTNTDSVKFEVIGNIYQNKEL